MSVALIASEQFEVSLGYGPVIALLATLLMIVAIIVMVTSRRRKAQ